MVCTTIIETGLDIANANTIIIENADKFGLSQLYQIRGRVGRRDKIAYCYLMIQPNKELTETAQKRLKSIKEFTRLGSGYKIAMRDLTIRGAGDLLGPQQAGFIDQVGLDMYLELLGNAISRHKGEPVSKAKEEKRAMLEFLKGIFRNNLQKMMVISYLFINKYEKLIRLKILNHINSEYRIYLVKFLKKYIRFLNKDGLIFL